jgi:hypothetical protein
VQTKSHLRQWKWDALFWVDPAKNHHNVNVSLDRDKKRASSL